MLTQLQCPSCTAPLEYDGAAATIQCPYCSNSVVVPNAWRTAAADAPGAPAAKMRTQPGPQPHAAPPRKQVRPPTVEHDPVYALQKSAPRRSGCAGAVVLMTLLLVIGGALFALVAVQPTMNASVDALVDVVTQRLPVTELSGSAQNLTAELTAGPALFLGSFGGAGSGPGKFEDARAIAVDNAGHLYVGEYAAGRIQVFDTEGAFQGQWRLGDNDFYVDQFAADRNSTLHIPFNRAVGLYAGATGVQRGALPPVDDALGGGYQDSVVVGADGAIYAVWDDDIVRFDRDGALTLRITDAIVAAVGGAETTTKLAVDGLGNIYALGVSQDVVVKYAADGAFVDRIAVANRGSAEEAASLRAGMALAIDSRGRVYVADILGIKVYDGDGHYVTTLDIPGVAFGLAIDDKDILYVAARTEILRYQLRA